MFYVDLENSSWWYKKDPALLHLSLDIYVLWWVYTSRDFYRDSFSCSGEFPSWWLDPMCKTATCPFFFINTDFFFCSQFDSFFFFFIKPYVEWGALFHRTNQHEGAFFQPHFQMLEIRKILFGKQKRVHVHCNLFPQSKLQDV